MLGLNTEQVKRARNEIDALEQGLSWAEPGDLVVHLVHLERTAVEEGLRGRGADF